MTIKIGVIVGSLRKASWNRKLAHELIKISPEELSLSIIEIGDLDLYNQDLDDENRPPASWERFRSEMKQVDAVLFLTPEYNRSIPSALKNAIDVGSRPYGQSIWQGKPAGVISTSPGAIGGFGANQHLRQTFVFLDIRCMQQPEAYLSAIDKLFDDKGAIVEKTLPFLESYMSQLHQWIKKLL